MGGGELLLLLVLGVGRRRGRRRVGEGRVGQVVQRVLLVVGVRMVRVKVRGRGRDEVVVVVVGMGMVGVGRRGSVLLPFDLDLHEEEGLLLRLVVAQVAAPRLHGGHRVCGRHGAGAGAAMVA